MSTPDPKFYPDGMSVPIERADVLDLVHHEDPTHRCVGRFHATGIPELIDKWIAGEIARTEINGGDIAAAINSTLGAVLGGLLLVYIRPEKRNERADTEGAHLARIIKATVADHEGTELRTMTPAEAEAMGAEVMAEAEARKAPPPLPPGFGTVALDTRRPEDAVDELLSLGSAQASAAARLVATGVHETIMDWVAAEIRDRHTEPADIYASAMTLSTTPIGFLLSFARQQDRASLIARFAKSFVTALEALAKRNEAQRETRGNG
jgi:hypothetical protein